MAAPELQVGEIDSLIVAVSNDQRRWTRIACTELGFAWLQPPSGAWQRCRLENISAGGASLIIDCNLKLRIGVTVELRMQRCQEKARVKHTSPLTDKLSRCGIEWLDQKPKNVVAFITAMFNLARIEPRPPCSGPQATDSSDPACPDDSFPSSA